MVGIQLGLCLDRRGPCAARGCVGKPHHLENVAPGLPSGHGGGGSWARRGQHPQRWWGHPKILTVAKRGDSWLGKAECPFGWH